MSSHEDPPGVAGAAESVRLPGLALCHRRQAGRHTIAFEGVLDLCTVGAASRALLEASDGAWELVLELSGVSFLDSAGLYAVLNARERCRQSGCSLRVASASPQVRALLGRMGLVEYLSLQPPPG
jgi:anti-anti-sigma factor